MWKEWKDKINSYLKNSDDSNHAKKGTYLIIAAICVGLLSLLWTPEPSVSPQITASAQMPAEGVSKAKAELAGELEYILSQVEGAGTVQVSITLSSDGVKNYARNTQTERRQTEEADLSGGNRNISEENEGSDIAVSGGSALLVEDNAPQIVGVLIVAEGAVNSQVKERLTDAATTLLNIAPHQVRVIARKGG